MAIMEKKLKGELLGKPLSKSELQTLAYIAQGYTNRQIAEARNVNEQTIKNFTSDIFRKLGCHTRTQAVITGIKRELIEV